MEEEKVPNNTCAACGEAFRSRNGLFKHLQDSGHAERKARKKLQY